jgi:hypothetical protein
VQPELNGVEPVPGRRAGELVAGRRADITLTTVTANFPDRDPIGFSSGEERDRVPGRGYRYIPEFKEQAARRVVDNSLPIAQVA